MAQVIRVRDMARNSMHELSPEQPVLRVPNDLLHPTGAVRMRGGLVDWLENGALKNGRVAEAHLADTHPGERVLIKLDPASPEDEWWLCEVNSVDGVAAATSHHPGNDPRPNAGQDASVKS